MEKKIKWIKGKDADFNDLIKYFESEAKIMTNPLFGKQVFKKEETEEDWDNKSSKGPRFKVKICGATSVGINEKENTNNNSICWYCEHYEKDHNIEICKNFSELSYEERLKELRLYFCCHGKGHVATYC